MILFILENNSLLKAAEENQLPKKHTVHDAESGKHSRVMYATEKQMLGQQGILGNWPLRH